MRCPNCDGYGRVSDYGPLGMDFYGEKECRDCDGTGQIYRKSMWDKKKNKDVDDKQTSDT